jgi:hypothetical protein
MGRPQILRGGPAGHLRGTLLVPWASDRMSVGLPVRDLTTSGGLASVANFPCQARGT